MIVDRGRCNQCNAQLTEGDARRNCRACLDRRKLGLGVEDHRKSLRTEGDVRVTFVERSGNKKTGRIPVSMTSSETCPPSCTWFNSGCYGEASFMRHHWSNVPKRGLTWREFCARVAALPDGTIWRHNEVGDLPGEGEHVDAAKLIALVAANRGKRGFTFTHKLGAAATALARRATESGFVVNLSADNPDIADSLAARGLGPIAVTLPVDERRPNFRTAGGHTVVVCPATRTDVKCKTCGLCAVATRKSFVGFPAHGGRAKLVTGLVRNPRKGTL